MAADRDDFASLRERIARVLWEHDPPYTTFEWDVAEPDDEDKAYYLGFADAIIADLGLEPVCWVPHGVGPSGELAVPLTPPCTVEWHRHFYRTARVSDSQEVPRG